MSKEAVESLPARENLLPPRLPQGIIVVGIGEKERIYPESLHPRIRRRRKLHELGVCSLPTAVFPNWGNVELVNLDRVLERLGEIGVGLDMRETDKLIIRTRFPIGMGRFSTPMGFFEKGVGSKWIEAKLRFNFVDWYKWLVDKFTASPDLMIHVDDPELQARSIHGRFFMSGDGDAELRLQGRSSHGRETNGGFVVYLKGGFPFRETDIREVVGGWKALKMVERTKPWLSYLREKYEEIEEAFGRRGVVIEFRLYNGGIKFPMQIYDVDWMF